MKYFAEIMANERNHPPLFQDDEDDAAVVVTGLPASTKPKKIDLEALDAKPFKDATDVDSIKKLERRLEEVKEKQVGKGKVRRNLFVNGGKEKLCRESVL